MNKEIIFVSGRICSGKQTYCSSFLPTISDHIVVSDIVKSKIKSTNRLALQQTKHLDRIIAHELARLIISSDKPFILIDGCRQLTIYKAVPNLVRRHFRQQVFDLVWIQCSFEERKRRFYDRKDKKDNGISFEQVEENDNALGLLQFESYALQHAKVVINEKLKI